jgi:hypothetical protein
MHNLGHMPQSSGNGRARGRLVRCCNKKSGVPSGGEYQYFGSLATIHKQLLSCIWKQTLHWAVYCGSLRTIHNFSFPLSEDRNHTEPYEIQVFFSADMKASAIAQERPAHCSTQLHVLHVSSVLYDAWVCLYGQYVYHQVMVANSMRLEEVKCSGLML